MENVYLWESIYKPYAYNSVRLKFKNKGKLMLFITSMIGFIYFFSLIASACSAESLANGDTHLKRTFR